MSAEGFPASEPASVDQELLDATDRVTGEQVDTGVAPDTIVLPPPPAGTVESKPAPAAAVFGQGPVPHETGRPVIPVPMPPNPEKVLGWNGGQWHDGKAVPETDQPADETEE